MPPFSEDFDAYLETGQFASLATYNGNTVKVILDTTFTDEMGIVGQKPVIQAKSSDFSSAAPGETVTINSVDYTIKEIQHDGTGWCFILIQEA